MAQVGKRAKSRGRRSGISDGMVSARSRSQLEARIREGVVPSAVEGKELCPVCGKWSEGWLIEAGKRTWYHFGRRWDCIQRFDHNPAEPGAVPEVRG